MSPNTKTIIIFTFIMRGEGGVRSVGLKNFLTAADEETLDLFR